MVVRLAIEELHPILLGFEELELDTNAVGVNGGNT